MEIKTGREIYLEGLDVKEANKESDYDEQTTKERTEVSETKWIKWDTVIKRTSMRFCLLCDTNLDKDIGEGEWHIPLCKKHRMKELKEIFTDK